MAFQNLLVAVFACIGVAKGASRPRSLMFWLTSEAEPESVVKARIANITNHHVNLTGVSPVMYGIDAAGRLGNLPGSVNLASYLTPLKALGLDIVPLVSLSGGVGGLARLLTPEGSKSFIETAVATAVKMDYDGYNLDNELRGKFTEASWAPILGYGKPWMDFMNNFADAMHAKNKTLSTDIAGCCGWTDTKVPKLPAGHCTGAFAVHEFVGTTCPMYATSHLDVVYGMSTYSDSIWNTTSPYGPGDVKSMASVASKIIGGSKYGFGFKGGWHIPGSASYGKIARETIDSLHALGVRHASHWANFPVTQEEWDAWGYFLHVDGEQNILV